MLPAYAPLQSNQAEPVTTVSPLTGPRSSEETSSSTVQDSVGPILPTSSRKGIRAFGGVRRSKVLLTLNQLAVMSQNGIELADAIETVASHCRDERLTESLQDIHRAITGGQSLSHAFAAHGQHFPSTLAPMLAVAEASGDVPQTLGRICQRLRGELQMRGTLVGAMIYPMILIGASAVVMGALVLGVLPQFAKVFASMGKPIPVYTQILLAIGEFCQAHWLFLAFGVASILATLVALRNHHFIQSPVQRFFMFGPLIRDAYRPLQAGRVLRTIASMVQGGVPLMQAVQLTKQTTNDENFLTSPPKES